MSAVLLAAIALTFLTLGYFLYSPKVAQWLDIKYDRPTPATEIDDGVDYVPAKHWWVLFGHHFASIAGAAPIIGPVIACLFWGWLPAVIWLVLGSIFFGAVHDFTSLVLSTRHQGESIATLTEASLGKAAKIVFSIFVFLALILVVAVFAAVAGKTLASTPQVVIPTFGLVVVAILIGFLMYHLHLNVGVCSTLGLILLLALIVIGYHVPIEVPAISVLGLHLEPAQFWTIVLLIYGLVASVTPVTILLQPRDHLAAGVLFVGMLLGFAGLIVANPTVKAPPFVVFNSDKGMLWPMLFVTVACGAVSGFHSLVASGTTSKQLSNMRDARRIGYGGMIVEAALSILAVLAVVAGLHWTSDTIPEGSIGFVYKDIFVNGGWIKAFGQGYGQLTYKLLGFLGEGAAPLGMLIGITMLKTFVMTTLDSATRITRYVGNELFGDTFGISVMKNKYVATLVVGLLSGSLALGNWQAIWPVFGAANQLIASLVFIVVSTYLLANNRNWLFTAIPAFLMLVTTLGALTCQMYDFLTDDSPKYMLASVSAILMILALFILLQSLRAVARIRRTGIKDEPPPPAGEGEMPHPHL
jgi:carbon starvation protein